MSVRYRTIRIIKFACLNLNYRAGVRLDVDATNWIKYAGLGPYQETWSDYAKESDGSYYMGTVGTILHRLGGGKCRGSELKFHHVPG